ncbi:cytochrome P450 [Penicillium nucicola]|uniref:cytochrome P450 n=1 Tax=Penicillium nucicola TaxID=1850975 RepID=UPI00254593D8|nr:cytochrome P450 [Penicillium nucicola]KAJ5770268.1 cytochrome P450 [Penicillium nucicola]
MSTTYSGPVAFLLLLSVLCWWFLSPRPSKLSLPPGPSLLNPMNLPKRAVWHTLHDMHKKYGPIFSLKLGSRTAIVVGDRQMIHDLLTKRGNNYSSRPRSILSDKYLTKGLQPGTMDYTPMMKDIRRGYTHLLNQQRSQEYRQIQDLQSKHLVYNLLSTNDFPAAFHTFTVSVTVALIYGESTSGVGEFSEDIAHTIELIKALKQAQTGLASALADVFPILDRLPRCLSRWKDRAELIHSNGKRAYTNSMKAALERDVWSFSRELFEKKETRDLSTEQLSFVIGDIFMGALDTIETTLKIFVMICLLHPDTVHEAQKELDSVVGRERLPSFEDRNRLPYVNGFISEVMRWRPLVPIGGPRAPDRDDEYMGYFIPAKCTIIANQWELDHDPKTFDNPESFQPERWIKNPNLPLSVFGFGRRVCPGQTVAMNSLFTTISRLLWAYDITSPDNTLDKVRAADYTGSSGVLYSPGPFEALLCVRSPGHQQVIEKEWDTADKDVNQMLADIKTNAFSKS